MRHTVVAFAVASLSLGCAAASNIRGHAGGRLLQSVSDTKRYIYREKADTVGRSGHVGIVITHHDYGESIFTCAQQPRTVYCRPAAYIKIQRAVRLRRYLYGLSSTETCRGRGGG